MEERKEALSQIRINIAELPDKEQAWADLIRLTMDEDTFVRGYAALSLGPVFPRVPDKEQAWADLQRLTMDENSFVLRAAARSLGPVFLHVPDKEQAWADLHRLTMDEDIFVQLEAALSLGPAFPHVPDKEQAWADLHRLTKDKDSSVHVFANHSLGRASIFRATVAEREEEFRKELERALEFFERASTEATIFDPSNFCLLFYWSFYTLTFNKQKPEVVVQVYLAAAKFATEGSKSKEQLCEAVENLANALTETQRLQEANLDTIKRNLNVYRQYCDHAADLIGAAEEETSGVAKVLRRGLSIIDERIKEIISEIQEKARAVCELTQGTALEDLGVKLNQQGENLLKIRDQNELVKGIETLLFILSELCARIPKDKRDFACETLEKAKNEPVPKNQISLINIVLGSMQSSIGEKHKFTLREIVYGTIIDIAIHALVIISIDHYLESSMDKIAPYLIITFVMVLAITIFALRKLPNAKSS
ncbi:MAG: HEAT repeat domain-containing protein [Methanophagales archaeon]|nr:HEAT repeat domain-containing protein [Methanophagales archaeon]